MTYPSSAAVSAGGATLASQYNNLRSDALLLGQAAADAVPLGSLLENYQTRLKLARSGTTLITISAEADTPVSLMVDGFMVQTTSNVTLAAGDAPAGVAAAYYVFANRAANSTTFTLSVSTSPTELDNQRRIGRFYWDGTKIIKDSVRTELAVLTSELLYLVNPLVCDGRLTLSTGVPVPPADIASSATVFFTPCVGSRVALYVTGFGWRIYEFSELSVSVAAFAADKNLDVFIYNNEGTLALEIVQWSNNTLRATALTYQDGVLVKSGSATHRYLGTVRTSAAGVTCDTKLKRFVWNFHNRYDRVLLVKDDTDSWTYATANIWQSLNNSAANRVEFVIGWDDTLVNLTASVLAENSGTGGLCIGICLDNNNDTNASIMRGLRGVAAVYNMGWKDCFYLDRPGIGYHYLQLTERISGGTGTFYGDKGTSPEITSGALGYLRV
jgi:hypothetical protein